VPPQDSEVVTNPKENGEVTVRLKGVLFLSAALLAANAFAQEFRGRIQGTVTDTSQASIAGANVTIVNAGTGVVTNRQTNETGHYLFDLVEPGTYAVAIEFPGFSRFVQESVLLQQRADVTVDATLKAGDLKETVTVTAEAIGVQFNTGKLETTVDSKLTNSMPQLYRTPFLLAQLDPAVEKDDYQSEYMPYHSWGPNHQQVGGGQTTRGPAGDGAPVGIGYKTYYVPSPDMVQEVNVQENAGTRSTGTARGRPSVHAGNQDPISGMERPLPGPISLPTPRGSRYRTVNLGRNHIYGGTLGHPILKNKLFNFVAYEGWKQTDPSTLIQTLPTDLERAGNFSQSLNNDGGLRTIYDPWSTKTSADGTTVTRTPFPGNIIPADRLDSVAVGYTQQLWKPNSACIGPYHVNNYSTSLPIRFPYKNFSDRADYHVNDKLRVSGRYSMFKTPVTSSNPTGSTYFVSDRGSDRDAKSITGDVTYTMSARTVINVRGEYHSFVDQSHYPSQFQRMGGTKSS
jgi:hypothetical protein